jgi:hypothetical protein
MCTTHSVGLTAEGNKWRGNVAEINGSTIVGYSFCNEARKDSNQALKDAFALKKLKEISNCPFATIKPNLFMINYRQFIRTDFPQRFDEETFLDNVIEWGLSILDESLLVIRLERNVYPCYVAKNNENFTKLSKILKQSTSINEY